MLLKIRLKTLIISSVDHILLKKRLLLFQLLEEKDALTAQIKEKENAQGSPERNRTDGGERTDPNFGLTLREGRYALKMIITLWNDIKFIFIIRYLCFLLY